LIVLGVKTKNIKALAPFKGYVIKEVTFAEIGGQINLEFDKRTGPRCPRCHAKIPRNKVGRRAVMDAPMPNGCVVYLTFPTAQGLCPSCNHYVTTCPAEVHPNSQATWRLMEMVSCWASVAPNNQVAAMFDISDSTVRRYDKEVLQRDTPPPDLDNLRTLLVDEKSVGRGHNYLTIVLNGDTGELLYMKPGKKKEVLDGFLKQLSESQRQSIVAVGIDRAGAYQASIQEHLPDADIVYDRFHLMMNVNKAVDEVRRAEWREAKGEEKKLIKGQRYLLLKNEENLDEDAADKLEGLLQANYSLSKAYLLKEQFRTIFNYQRQDRAEEALRNWCELAEVSKLQPFRRLARGLLKESSRVCGYVKHKLTSGLIEGTNNLISRVIHQACGIRDLDYLFLKMRYQTVMRF
jgi:transposase